MIFEITRKETESFYMYVEAETKEQAIEIAENKESESWRSSQTFNAEIDTVEEVKQPEAIHGLYIETETDYFRFDKENPEDRTQQ